MPRTTKTSSREAATRVDSPGARGTPTPARPAGSAPKAAGSGSVRARAKKAQPAFEELRRAALLAERSTHLLQAEELTAQATSLAQEHEPGDVHFDEEGGEGGTANVERELDLQLSAQVLQAVDEIDRALAKIEAGTYGRCERCHQPIPAARLEALPYAALCVTCKAGGLSSRR